ncbi:MAG: hypothetical protein LBP22_00465 [Deltaproteobacteria bacterium]|jgi:hypothetical protein|nr:hypothetical protein [Deltaproteobacteria bacterium]
MPVQNGRFVHKNLNPELFSRRLPEFNRKPASAILSPENEFKIKIKELGLILEGGPVMDGKIHKICAEGGTGSRKSGSYQVQADASNQGWISSFKTGQRLAWLYSGQVTEKPESEVSFQTKESTLKTEPIEAISLQKFEPNSPMGIRGLRSKRRREGDEELNNLA